MISRIHIAVLVAFLGAPPAGAQGKKAGQSKPPAQRTSDLDDAEMAADAEKLRQASAQTVRRFHEVLDDLLAEFGYDVKQGQLRGLKNLAIRRVDVSQALPKTYRKYTEMLVQERIRENSQVRIITCLSCQSRTSRLVKGKIVITSPATNIAELKTAADRLGIDHFMDVILVYHTTHMVLAFQVYRVDTNELVWTRTYNSETIRSRYQKLAIDYSQVAKSRPGEDYQPEYRFLIGAGGGGIPNVGGTTTDSQMLTFQIRSTEKFDSRRSEFGMLFAGYMTTSSILDEYPVLSGTGGDTTTAEEEVDPDLTNPAQPDPFTMAFGIYATYSHNFLGRVESYANVRQGLHLGLGGFMASGYLAPTARAGWDMYFGRRFAMSFGLVMIAPSQVIMEGQTLQTNGGIGADVVLSFNY